MLLEMMGPIESIRMEKIGHMKSELQPILRNLANALNFLYLDCDTRGLDPFVGPNNIPIECKKIINQCGTKIR